MKLRSSSALRARPHTREARSRKSTRVIRKLSLQRRCKNDVGEHMTRNIYDSEIGTASGGPAGEGSVMVPPVDFVLMPSPPPSCSVMTPLDALTHDIYGHTSVSAGPIFSSRLNLSSWGRHWHSFTRFLNRERLMMTAIIDLWCERVHHAILS